MIPGTRYKQTEKIGEGAWGTVYGATDTKTGRTVAVKVLHPSKIAEVQLKHRALTLEEIAQKECCTGLDPHPNIVGRMYDEQDGTPLIVMEKYGNNLEQHMHKDLSFSPVAYLSPEETLRILKDVGKGMQHIHTELKRAHGDIAPKNIVFDKHGTAKLTDFGTATYFGSGRSDNPRDMIGYSPFRAPELEIEGSHPTTSSDIWMVGAVAYRMLSGDTPTNGTFDAEFVPKPFKAFLNNTLAKNPEDRYSNAQELLDGLRKVEKWYVRRTPASRLKRWGSVAACLGTLVAGYCTLDHFNQKHQEAVQEQKDRTTFEKKKHIIHLHKYGGSAMDSMDVLSLKNLDAWIDKFGNKELGYAAFVNPEATYLALEHAEQNNIEPTWKNVNEILRTQNEAVWLDILIATEYLVDGFARSDSGAPNRIKKKWKAVENKVLQDRERKRVNAYVQKKLSEK